MNEMQANIKKGLLVLLVLIILLSVYFFYVLFFYGDRWFSNAYNPRVRMNVIEPKIIPGDIKDRNDRILATTQKGIRKNPNTGEDQVYYYRSYSGGDAQAKSAAHVVGFHDASYGRAGAEAFHISYLMGYNNHFYERIYQKIFLSQEIGNTIILTIDFELQKYIDNAMGRTKGSVVVLDVKTGEILAIVSHPTFNPNQLNKEDIKGDVLFPRATEGLYPPGSIFKIITGIAALENIQDISQRTFDCQGEFQIDSQKIPCFNGEKHGNVNLTEALAVSCNGMFAELGLELGREIILKTGESFGFNQDFLFPDLKVVSSRLQLKSSVSREVLGRSSIGQQGVLVSPLHMAMVGAAVANDGVMMQPKLLLKVIGRNEKVQKKLETKIYKKAMSPENAKIVQEMMKAVVTDGTGTGANIQGIQIAGKTGTAEVISKNSEIQNQAWFIGFAPAHQPRIAIAVVLEDVPHGDTGGRVAAPLAGKILKQAIELEY